MKSPLRVGVLIDDGTMPALLKYLLKCQNSTYNIVLVISCKSPLLDSSGRFYFIRKLQNRGFPRFARSASLYIIEKLELFFLSCLPAFRTAIDKCRIASYYYSSCELTYHQIEVIPKLTQSKYRVVLSESDIKQIQEHNLDVVIRANSGILCGDILSVAHHGVISYHHGDPSRFRGSYHGFWEAYNKASSIGFVIQRLTETLDAGNILYQGNIAATPFYALNKLRITAKSFPFILLVLSHLSSKQQTSITGDSTINIFPYKYSTCPSFYDQSRYIVSNLNFLFLKILSILFGQRREWNILTGKCSHNNILLANGQLITNPPGTFLADPYNFFFKNNHYILVEQYDYSKKRAHISLMHCSNGEINNSITPLIVEPFHISFPRLFQFAGHFYLTLESCSKPGLRIYKADEFPFSWKLYSVAQSHLYLADPIIVEENSTWYLLANIDSACIGDHDSELFVFYADNPLSDTWSPVPGNPQIFDSRIARNGGLFRFGDTLYRIGQEQSSTTYGAAFTLSSIDLLRHDTPYDESYVTRVGPTFMPGTTGIHTLTLADNQYVADVLITKNIYIETAKSLFRRLKKHVI
ncbi:formyltransferase family protein [Synechococcus sp. LA31]|uniref:glucosamine inositolphosphorylceramide transferase family protein n=1 Tax=Synechococcus sp. LA31 TaxID=2741953 RepID=UPI001BDBC5A2|nr:formyltransferase family protein [Synechococcus sp. LA31]QVV68733.1 hypothetical protein KJJ24_06355 [Synechococcus sp. LA31]